MELRDQWVGSIVRENSVIFNLKREIVIAHGIEVMRLLSRIFFHEVVLALISFPAYFFLSTRSLPNSHQQSYRLRRAVTVLVLIPLTALWGIRLTVHIMQKIQGDVTNFTYGPRGTGTAGGGQEWWRIIASVPESPRIATPVFYPVSQTSSTFFIAGTSESGSEVIIAVQRQAIREATLFLSAPLGHDRHWSIDKQVVKNFSPGTYMVSVISYDKALHQRSAISPVVTVEIDQNGWQEFWSVISFGVYGLGGALLLLGIFFSLVGKT